MKILVCIKPVTKNLVPQFKDLFENYSINPYDLHAIKDILQLKKNSNDSIEITCLSMGVSDSIEVLKKCLAMGVDNVTLLSDSSFAGSDTVATTYILAKAIKYLGEYDIIVCGAKSIDGETGQVAYGLAERIGLPCFANVNTITDVHKNNAYFEQYIDGKCRTVKTLNPVVLVYKDLSLELGAISLLALKNVQRKEIKVINANDIEANKDRCGINGSKTRVIGISEIKYNKCTRFIQGDCRNKATMLLNCINIIR